jgi:single-strand DNA-binding protein
MADIDHVILIGRLTRDAELKYTPSGTPLAKFSVAVNRKHKDGDEWKEEANFFDIVLWGKTAEALNQYLVKGKQVAVSGELHQNRWEQDGQQRSKVEIVAETIQLLGGGEARGEARAEPKAQEPRVIMERQPTDGDEFPDDIPF